MMKPEIYSSCALFTCNCCGYQTEIYSPVEWLPYFLEPPQVLSPLLCETCDKPFKVSFDPGLIYRTDIDNTVPLHPQCAGLPEGKKACKDCLDIDKLHWTEVEVYCINCERDSMYFTEYTTGKQIEVFKEWCAEWAKPSAPDMPYTDKDGREWYGRFTDFRAN